MNKKMFYSKLIFSIVFGIFMVSLPILAHESIAHVMSVMISYTLIVSLGLYRYNTMLKKQEYKMDERTMAIGYKSTTYSYTAYILIIATLMLVDNYFKTFSSVSFQVFAMSSLYFLLISKVIVYYILVKRN